MNSAKRIRSALAGLTSLLFCLGMGLFFALIFGFFIKTTDEYDCVIQTVQQDNQVVRAVGEPVEAGFWAWMPYYESGGGEMSTSFTTAVSGPRGNGQISAQVYRNPAQSSLIIEYSGDGGDIDVYSGPYQCP